MAIPEDPVLREIVTAGIRRAKPGVPTAVEVSEGMTHQLQEVKTQLRRRAANHPLLETDTVTSTTKGIQRYAQPTDLSTVLSVSLFDGPDDFRGTAQAGASTTITLASDFDQDSDTVIGLYVVTTGGTGANQFRQVTGYNNTTKVVTVESAWTTNPDSSTTYLVSNRLIPMTSIDLRREIEGLQTTFVEGRPTAYSMFNQTLYFDYTPDKIYGVWWKYRADIDRLDQTSSVFTKILREWRDVWVQGIAVWSMQRFDDARWGDTLIIYNRLLDEIGVEASTVTQIDYRDL